jgi:hypothetical protein
LPVGDDDELLDFERLSLLYTQLPTNSRTSRKQQPANDWNTTDYLLWSIEYDLRALQWSLMDKKARRGQSAPKPLQTPQEHAQNLEHKKNAEKNKNEINRLLGIEE